jgi:preprotein translocase subunit SecB
MNTPEQNVSGEPLENLVDVGGFPCQLVDVRLYEISVKRHQPDRKGQEPASLKVLLHQGNEPPSTQQFGLLLSFESDLPFADAPEYTISLAIEGLFKLIVDANTIRPETLERFKVADAMVLLWPYLRQTLHDITTRMRLDIPPLPVVDARSLVMIEDEEDKEPLRV